MASKYLQRKSAHARRGRTQIVPYKRAKWRKWDLYVSSCFDNPWFARTVPWADTFHGVGEKWVESGERLYMCHPLAARYDRLLCPNRRLAQQFERHPRFLKTPESLRLTGLAKSDALVRLNTGEIRAALRRVLGIEPDQRVVLFSPTWGTDGLLARHAEAVMDACVEAGASLIVKLHACSYLRDVEFCGGVDWEARIDEWAKQKGFRHFPRADLTSLMLLADVMIADFGSAPVEYCLVDRPLIFFAVPEQARRTGGDRFQFNALCDAGGVTTLDELKRRLADALRGVDEAGPQRQALREEFFHAAGSATANSLQEMYALMELDMPSDLVDGYWDARRASILAAPAGFLGLGGT